jgi:hypothetical protein
MPQAWKKAVAKLAASPRAAQIQAQLEPCGRCAQHVHEPLVQGTGRRRSSHDLIGRHARLEHPRGMAQPGFEFMAQGRRPLDETDWLIDRPQVRRLAGGFVRSAEV